MSAVPFKNLIKTSLFTDDSFQPLLKRSDQYRKVTQVALLHFQSISKSFQSYENSYQKLIVDYEEDIQISQISVPQYYQKYIQLYRNIWSEQKSFDDRLANNLKELIALCDSLFGNFSHTIFNFQGLIRSYKAHEQVLVELSKKYLRTHKNMLTSVDLYKETFTDVKIIYNMDEKNKRYAICEANHKNLLEELDTIEQKTSQLSQQKTDIVSAYKDIDKEFALTLKAIGSKIIAMSKSFVSDFCQMQKIIITYLAEKKFTLEKVELKTFFSSESKLKIDDFFDVQVDPGKLEFYPAFVVYHKNIKEEYYPQLGALFKAVVKETEEKIENRKRLSKKVLQFTINFFKIYEKGYYLSLKEIIANFQKVKKRLSEIFGARLCSFLKSIHSIFELSIGINQKLLKRINAKLKMVEVTVIEQNKILELFQRQFKLTIDKFVQKKNLKKAEKELNEFTEEEPSLTEIDNLKKSISQKSEHLAMLIDGFVEKFKKNYENIKLHYNSIVNDISISTNEYYSLCCEYQQLYFGEDEFVKNYKKYENDISAALQNQRKFFKQINFGCLLTDDPGNIVFESEIGKLEEYKKLKKPTQIEVVSKQSKEEKNQIKNRQSVSSVSVQEEQANSPQHKKEKAQNANKHTEFIQSKIAFLPDQKFYKSFSCALSDKILLSGRVYITNKRLCFHSNFNPNNVFFGDTFLQIPRNDIRKIQKRFNAIVFDNSISLTTVNGEVFLTSFFSRNEAFNLMCEALEIDTDQCMFQPDTIKEQIAQEAKEMPEADDLPQEKQEQRQESIQKMLPNFPYKEIVKTQFAYPGFTAYKFLKLFDMGGQMTFNRKTFKNFGIYMKEVYEHKQYVYGEWSPSSPSDFLNAVNIKESTPLSFSRKVTCMVPVANTGVPFMPKQAKSQQSQTLYIISKDKYILQSSIQNSGIPYADCFNLKMRRIIETINQNCCQMTVNFHVNFVTSTMMKGVIQSKSTEESKVAMLKLQTQIKKYLGHLERAKIKAKSQNSKCANEAQAANNTNNEEYEKQIEGLKDSQQKLQNEVKKCKVTIDLGKKILLGSVVLNILLILILLR